MFTYVKVTNNPDKVISYWCLINILSRSQNIAFRLHRGRYAEDPGKIRGRPPRKSHHGVTTLLKCTRHQQDTNRVGAGHFKFSFYLHRRRSPRKIRGSHRGSQIAPPAPFSAEGPFLASPVELLVATMVAGHHGGHHIIKNLFRLDRGRSAEDHRGSDNFETRLC